MIVVGLKKLEEFCKLHADVIEQINAWLCEVGKAQWQKPQDIKERYMSASILTDNGVVFNIKGNKYRIYVVISYKNGIVSIKKAGTHREYEKWDLKERRGDD